MSTGTPTADQATTTTSIPENNGGPYSADQEVNNLVMKLFQDQRQAIDDDRAMFQANQTRISQFYDRKGGAVLPPQIQQELIPLLLSCPQVIPGVTFFAKSLIQSMAAAAGAQLAKSLQAMNASIPTTPTQPPAGA